MANVLNNNIIVTEFKLKLCYYFNFQTWEKYEHFYLPAMD